MSDNTIPERTRRILERWAAGEVGALTNFTGALVENDLREAVWSADGENLAALKAIVDWMWNEIPEDCWGSSAKRAAWVERHSREEARP